MPAHAHPRRDYFRLTRPNSRSLGIGCGRSTMPVQNINGTHDPVIPSSQISPTSKPGTGILVVRKIIPLEVAIRRNPRAPSPTGVRRIRLSFQFFTRIASSAVFAPRCQAPAKYNCVSWSKFIQVISHFDAVASRAGSILLNFSRQLGVSAAIASAMPAPLPEMHQFHHFAHAVTPSEPMRVSFDFITTSRSRPLVQHARNKTRCAGSCGERLHRNRAAILWASLSIAAWLCVTSKTYAADGRHLGAAGLPLIPRASDFTTPIYRVHSVPAYTPVSWILKGYINRRDGCRRDSSESPPGRLLLTTCPPAPTTGHRRRENIRWTSWPTTGIAPL